MKALRLSRLIGRLLFPVLAVMVAGLDAADASPDDNWDSQFGVPGGDGPIYAILVAGSDVYFGGSFTQVSGTSATNIAKFDGTNWVALGGGLSGGVFPVVLALAIWNGDLYAGGSFDEADGVLVNRIARWDGHTWHPVGSGVSGIVRALAGAEAKLIAGGSFNLAGGIPAVNIAQWNGTNWSVLGSGVSGPYSGAAVDSMVAAGSELYVGGRFRTAGGVAATNVAKWNGSVWSALGNGLRHNDGPDWADNGIVRAMATSQGRIFAAGEFSKAGDASVSNIAQWDGTNWTALGAGVGATYALAANGTEIFAGGFFSADNHIARWSDDSWSQLGSGIGGGPEGGAVWALAAAGSELFPGGPFSLAGGKSANNIALWHIPHSLKIQRVPNAVALSWPATGTNFLLEASSDLVQTNWQVVPQAPPTGTNFLLEASASVPATNWSQVLQPLTIQNGQCVVTNALGPATEFFRLRRR